MSANPVEHLTEVLGQYGWSFEIEVYPNGKRLIIADHPLVPTIQLGLPTGSDPSSIIEGFIRGPEVSLAREAPPDCPNAVLVRDLRELAAELSWTDQSLARLAEVLREREALTTA